MRQSGSQVLGKGIYSLAEAERLIGLSPSTIRRYVFGYGYSHRDRRRLSPPAFEADYLAVGASGDHVLPGLSFLDLMELRVVAYFFRVGIRGHEVRSAQIATGKRLGSAHPFCTGRFSTLGPRILVDTLGEHGSDGIVEAAKGQRLMREVIEPYLHEVEISRDLPVLWRPAEGGGRVILDPKRSFGRPIMEKSGVPTDVLAAASCSWRDTEKVARWYEVEVDEVRAAVKFEVRKAA